MVTRILLACLLLPLVVACNVQTGVYPVENAIQKCSDRDFGFEGIWSAAQNDEVQQDLSLFQLEISRNESYSAMLSDSDGTLKIEYEFRAAELSKKHPHAIVEIESKDGSYRRLAIAVADERQLCLWMIDGRKIGSQLYDDGIAAVIEHFKFYSSIRCEPEKLIEFIRRNSSKITGSYQIFYRQKN